VRGEALGELELPVLLIVQKERGEAYGWLIQYRLFLHFRRQLALGTICKTLHRLEAKGYAQSRWGSPRPEPGGRGRKLYTITANGSAALESGVHHLSVTLENSVVMAWGTRVGKRSAANKATSAPAERYSAGASLSPVRSSSHSAMSGVVPPNTATPRL